MKATAAPEKGGPRTNRDIRAVQVQLIDAEGKNQGVINLADAQRQAEEAGLDLVEIVPNATPPVCKILDFGKYRFLEQKKSAEARKRQKVVEIKEIKLGRASTTTTTKSRCARSCGSSRRGTRSR